MTLPKNIVLLILISFFYAPLCLASENIFYTLRNKLPDRMSSPSATDNSLEKNYKKINILIPQAYIIYGNGDVAGEIDHATLEFASKHAMKIMPLITNTKFDKDIAHQFLSDTQAQEKAVHAIVAFCLKNHFYGVQFDFEMIALDDRDRLTHFYQYAANEFHKNGFMISFAIAPVVSDPPYSSIFLTKLYTNWQGAYDMEKIGKYADFVSLMAYNQHAQGTTPGPTGSYPWTEQVVKHALKYIPARKISLGIPDYSNYWYVGTYLGDPSGKLKVIMDGISYKTAMELIHKHNATLQWDEKAKVNYAMYEHHWLNEYIFIENAKSFKAKNALVKKYKLRGMSVFDLGSEDPLIWKIISLK